MNSLQATKATVVDAPEDETIAHSQYADLTQEPEPDESLLTSDYGYQAPTAVNEAESDYTVSWEHPRLADWIEHVCEGVREGEDTSHELTEEMSRCMWGPVEPGVPATLVPKLPPLRPHVKGKAKEETKKD